MSPLPAALRPLKERAGARYRALADRVGERVFARGADLGDTRRRVQLQELGLKTPDRHRYQASPWTALPRGLRRRDVAADDVFVEFGCGKGRVVFQAARRYPLRRVVGVDLAESLIEVARENIERNRRLLRCQDVELVAADVLSWEIPADMTIAYLYNPFGGEVFAGAIRRIVESIDRHPRTVRIVYVFPMLDEVIEATGRFRLARRSKGLRPSHVPSWISVWESV